MNFKGLKLNFYTTGEARGTRYTFGNSTVDIIWDNDNYEFIYYNQGEKKIQEFTDDLPKLISLQIKELYEGFDIGAHEIQSCINTLQAYKKRLCANNL